jgi:CheY-like chemotaxis protein
MAIDTAHPLLLLENNADDVTFVRRALTKRRILNPLLVARSAGDARRTISESGTGLLPVLAIVDVRLDGRETGLDFLRWLRQQQSPAAQIPALMFTVSNDHSDEAHATSLGALAYLRKPTTPESLHDAVEQVGLMWRKPDQPGYDGIVISPNSRARKRKPRDA